MYTHRAFVTSVRASVFAPQISTYRNATLPLRLLLRPCLLLCLPLCALLLHGLLWWQAVEHLRVALHSRELHWHLKALEAHLPM